MTPPLIRETGFREYDARWRLGEDLDLAGAEALGLGLGTYFRQRGETRVVSGHDYRSYSRDVQSALIRGLVRAGCEVLDIGLALSPTAYFAQFHLNAPCVAMVTASHNENGWTGVKMGIGAPFTFGPEDIARVRDLVLKGGAEEAPGGRVIPVPDIAEAYIDDVARRCALSRPLKVVCACGNGTAGVFAPEALRRMGAEVIELDCELDFTFPRYNPNPEDVDMLAAMAEAVRTHGADMALGFDGDGDRCGVVDDQGRFIFADKIGLLIARDLAPRFAEARFVVDVKSTGLFGRDAVLQRHGAETLYWKTGHSYIKRKTAETGALAGFEKSGHFMLSEPLGRGYDCGLTAAAAVLGLVDRAGGKPLSALVDELPVVHTSLTMNVHCADEEKYRVADAVREAYQALAARGETLLGRAIAEVNTVNGVRVTLEDGSWLLVRGSSNKPEIVVVVESVASHEDMRALFHAEVKPRLGAHPEVGAYNQEI
jgi:phosphomannomutase / phosphoglucomutase